MLLITSFSHVRMLAMDTLVSGYLGVRSTLLSGLQYVSNPVMQGSMFVVRESSDAVGKIPGVKLLSNATIDHTQGFKSCLALLGFWSVPLIYNFARWQLKKRRVKRKIGAEPTEANLKIFHTNRVNNGNGILSEALHDIRSPEISAPDLRTPIPQALINLMSEYDVNTTENAEQEIKARVDRDMNEVAYHPLISPNLPAFHPPLAAAPQPRQKAIRYLMGMTDICLGTVCAKRLLWNGGLKVLWRGMAYGPGRIETLITMALGEVGSFIGLSKLYTKIFYSPIWRNDKYMEIGHSLFLKCCLFLNMMAINSFITKRLKPA